MGIWYNIVYYNNCSSVRVCRRAGLRSQRLGTPTAATTVRLAPTEQRARVGERRLAKVAAGATVDSVVDAVVI